MNDEDMLTIEQYKQVYEEQRQLWILFWRIPTIAATIAAALFTAVFIYLWPRDQWLESGVVLLIGHILTFMLSFVAHKHRFFQSIWVGTLTNIEENLAFRSIIQRTTSPESEIKPKKEYWFGKKARWHQSPSGQNLLIIALFIISLISLGFSMFAFYQNSPCTFGIAFPCWLLALLVWIFLSTVKYQK